MGARRRETSLGWACAKGFIVLALALSVASCGAPLGDYQDPAADLTREDFENVLGSSNFAAAPSPQPKLRRFPT